MEVRGVEPLTKPPQEALAVGILENPCAFSCALFEKSDHFWCSEALFRASFLFVYYTLRSCIYAIIFWHSKNKKVCL